MRPWQILFCHLGVLAVQSIPLCLVCIFVANFFPIRVYPCSSVVLPNLRLSGQTRSPLRHQIKPDFISLRVAADVFSM